MEVLTLDESYRDILDVANKDMNQHYPPRIFTQHYRLVTEALLDELVKLYPTNNSIVSILQPFIESVEVNVRNGEIQFPEDYRNFLSMGVYVRDESEGSKEITACNKEGIKICEIETKPSVEDIKFAALKRTCRSNPVDLKTIDEWDIATGHPYKKPTLKMPICCIFSGRSISICPHDVEQVVLRYVRKPKKYVYGYKMLPDDTFQNDLTSTIESEWEPTARQYLNKGMNTLYSIFARDGEMNEGNLQIKK